MGISYKKTLTKTRRKTRDVDQVKADTLSPAHLARFTSTKAAEDLPGLGLHYCIPCAKWFETPTALTAHHRGKPHRRRVKQLEVEPYTQKEAEAAAGLGVQSHYSSIGAPTATTTTAATPMDVATTEVIMS